MTNELETIKVTEQGSKHMRFNGVEFWANSFGVIMQTSDWGIVDQLVATGFATRKFYKHLLGHVEYTLKA